MLIRRIIFDLILLVIVITTPWWFILVLVLAGLFYFNKFYEMVFIGLLMDSIYGSSVIFSNFPYIITTLSVIFLFFVTWFKKRLMMY